MAAPLDGSTPSMRREQGRIKQGRILDKKILLPTFIQKICTKSIAMVSILDKKIILPTFFLKIWTKKYINGKHRLYRVFF